MLVFKVHSDLVVIKVRLVSVDLVDHLDLVEFNPTLSIHKVKLQVVVDPSAQGQVAVDRSQAQMLVLHQVHQLTHHSQVLPVQAIHLEHLKDPVA